MQQSDKGYLAYFGGRRGAQRNPRNYQRRDDGSHIFHHTDSYYEWWYFDASFDNGYHLVATFHYRNVFLNPMIPSVQMFIYSPDGSRIERYAPIQEKNARADPDYCHVVMGENRVQDMGDHYEVILNMKGAAARLLFRNVVPPWKPGEGFNYKDEENGLTAGWVVPIPHGTVEGSLELEGERMAVTGSGYHDHNWGNFRCHETFKGWYWGRIHHPDYCVDYGWVLPRETGAPVASPLLIGRPGEILLSTDCLALKLRDMRTDEAAKTACAWGLTLRADELGVVFSMEIETRSVLESTRLPRVTDWDQYYFRFLADYRMRIQVDGSDDRIAGEMLHEYIKL